MKKKILIIFTIVLIVFLVLLVYIFEKEPCRDKGVSFHFIPKRVADLDTSKKMMWGLMVSAVNNKIPKITYVFQEANDLIDYFYTQPFLVRANGVWIVTTNPDAYSEQEKEILENIKKICKKKSIPLRICRGMDLPSGWKIIVK